MSGINFVPSEEKAEKKKHPSRPIGDIEYTEGARLDETEEFQPLSPPKQTGKKQKKKSAHQQKKTSFLSWRTARQHPTKKLPEYHLAPPHEEVEKTDFAHPFVQPSQEEPVPHTLKPQPMTSSQPQSPQPQSQLQSASSVEHSATPPSSPLPISPTPPPTPKQPKPPQPAPEVKQAKEHIEKLRTHEQTVPDRIEPGLLVNLLPEEALSAVQSRNYIRDLGMVALTMIFVAVIVFTGMNVYQRKITIDTIHREEDIQFVEQRIASFSELQQNALIVNERLSAVEEVLATHVYWTPFFDFIEEFTLPTVYYQSVAGSAVTGEFSFDVIAKDFAQIEPQVRLLESSVFVNEVRVSSAAGHSVQTAQQISPEETASSGVAFTMDVFFDMSLFHKPLAHDIDAIEE